jgi:hypothetical protein
MRTRTSSFQMTVVVETAAEPVRIAKLPAAATITLWRQRAFSDYRTIPGVMSSSRSS